jgi:precorrin-6B C5,15-methyltransferase / cobalt-precorrin-6B C5,C15-methyltransferase
MEVSKENTSSRWLSIVGIGQDGAGGLSPLAKSLVSSAELVVGGARHLELAAQLIKGERLPWPSPLHNAFPEILARRGRPVVVLASGDPFNFGVGKQIASLVSADELVSVPQPSSFSLAANRLSWALQDAATIALHGRALESLIRYLQPGARILALSWDGSTPAKAAKLLRERGFGYSSLAVLEDLGAPKERVTHHRADGFELTGVNPLNVIAIEVAAGPKSRVIGLSPGLDDDFFESDGQLTKREVRAVTLAALAPRQGELLWDIGLGAGSVAIEWLLRHPSLKAIGVEEREDRAARAMRNALALGAPDLQVIIGHAPQALAGLSPPDAVFIGGGFTDEGVFEAAWTALRPGGRIVANAVTLESETRLKEAFERHGGELVRIGIDKAVKIGGFHGWRPAMPVTQWRAVKP